MSVVLDEANCFLVKMLALCHVSEGSEQGLERFLVGVHADSFNEKFALADILGVNVGGTSFSYSSSGSLFLSFSFGLRS